MNTRIERETPLPATHSASLWALLFFLALCFSAGIVGSALSDEGGTQWYFLLRKPDWAPPPWVFGPVWAFLYASMAFSAWWVWRMPDSLERRRALGLFLLQLFFNAAWSPVFFRLGAIALSVVVIALLWATLLLTTFAFSRLSRPAALLLLPYLAWVSFAAFLDIRIWQLNRSDVAEQQSISVLSGLERS